MTTYREAGACRTPRRAVLGVAIGTALALAAAGCGSGSDSGGVPGGDTSAATTGGHLKQMQQQDSATVGVVNQPPFSGVSPTGGTVGFSPELAHRILSDLGVHNMKAVVGQYGDMIPGLKANRWDFVAASLVVTPVRCQQVIFSEPIVSDYVRLASTASDVPTSLKGVIAKPEMKVGILTGSTYIQQFEKAGMPKSRFVEFNDIRSGLAGLLAGRIDVMAGSATGFNIKGLDPKIKLGPRLSDLPPSISAFALKQSDTQLRDAINADLKKLKQSGEYATILKKWGFTGDEVKGLTSEQGCSGSAS